VRERGYIKRRKRERVQEGMEGADSSGITGGTGKRESTVRLGREKRAVIWKGPITERRVRRRSYKKGNGQGEERCWLNCYHQMGGGKSGGGKGGRKSTR